MATKQCSKCGHTKPLDSFYRAPRGRDGRASLCKDCDKSALRLRLAASKNASIKRYERTINGLLMRRYRAMKSRVSDGNGKRAHLYFGKELMPKDDFYLWARQSDEFQRLFAAWEQSGYQMKLAPSVDRIDQKHGYVLGNIQWVTHSENSGRKTLNER